MRPDPLAVQQPWQQGRTLLTQTTRGWTQEQWDENEAVEKRMIFANFHDEDQGRGRMFIASCETEEQAAALVGENTRLRYHCDQLEAEVARRKDEACVLREELHKRPAPKIGEVVMDGKVPRVLEILDITHSGDALRILVAGVGDAK